MRKGKNQLTNGVILSYISQGLQILLTLFYTPVMLRLLGKSEYGLYQIAYSVVSYLTLFTFGFSSAYVKFYATCMVKKDAEKEVAKLNGMFLSIFSVLGLLVLTIGAVLAINTEYVLGGKLTAQELDTSKILMWIMVINSSIHFPLIVFNNHIIAKEKFIWLQLLNMVGIILNPIMTFPMLLMGFKSVSLALALLAITVVKLVTNVWYCLFNLKMRFSFKNMQFSLFKEVGTFSFFIFLETLVSLINISLDRFLLGKLVGSVSVAIYSVGGQINTLYTSLSTSISSVFTPRINRLVAEKRDIAELSKLFIRVGKIQYAVLLLILAGFITFGKRFILIWAGSGYENAYLVACVLIIPNTINLIQNIAIEIQRAMGLQKYRSYMYTVIAIMNILVSLVLIHYFEEVGAAMGTGIAWIIGSGIIMNWFYQKKVGLDIGLFWKEIGKMTLGIVPCLIYGIIVFRLSNSVSLLQYVGLIAVMVLIYIVSLFFLGMNNVERQKVKSFLKNFYSTKEQDAQD